MFNSNIRAAFEARIEENYQQKLDEWRQMSPEELIENAEQIAAIQMLRKQLSDSLVDENVAYLLRFADPLSVMRDRWIEENGVEALHDEEISQAFWNLQDWGDAENCYELAPGFYCEQTMQSGEITMEQEALKAGFPAEKLDALRFYMGERGLNVEGELQSHLGQMYEKNVPASTRRYLDRHDVPKQVAHQEDKNNEPLEQAEPEYSGPVMSM